MGQRTSLTPEERQYTQAIIYAARKKAFKDVTVPLGEDIFKVPVPPDFRPQTTVVGRPYEAQEVQRLLNVAPELRGRASNVTFGPTQDVMDYFKWRKWPQMGPQDFGDSTSGGLTVDDRISVNPTIETYGSELRNTLGHEFSHIMGYDEPQAYPMGEMYASPLQYDPLRETLEHIIRRGKTMRQGVPIGR